jgi:hypothetical protein
MRKQDRRFLVPQLLLISEEMKYRVVQHTICNWQRPDNRQESHDPKSEVHSCSSGSLVEDDKELV